MSDGEDEPYRGQERRVPRYNEQLLSHFVSEGMEEVKGLRSDVQKLHGSITEVAVTLKGVVTHQDDTKDHEKRIVTLETQSATVRWMLTFLVSLIAIGVVLLIAIWPKK